MASDLSYNDIQSLLSTAINNGLTDRETSCWIRDVFPSYFVYFDPTTSKLYRRDYVVGADNAVTMGDVTEVIQQTNYETVKPAAFSLEGEFSEGQDESGEFITVKGKIFAAGNYPDKNFTLTSEEMAQAVAAFKPVKLDLEHVSTPLDGKLGTLEAVEIAENGTDLIGTVKLPKWLDSVLADMPRKVSATWNRATKQLAGLALVNKPRVSDAALMSAFSQAQVEFAGKRNSDTDQKHLQAAHDNLVQAGADCKTEMSNNGVETPSNANTEETTPMAETTTTNNEAQFSAADFATMQARITAQEASIAQFKADKRHSEAVNFASTFIGQGHVLPAAKAGLVAVFEQALKDDEVGTAEFASFSTNGQTVDNRTKALVALFSSLPASPLTRELVSATGEITQDAQGLIALFGNNPNLQQDKEKAVETEKKELLSLTPLGQTVIKNAGK